MTDQKTDPQAAKPADSDSENTKGEGNYAASRKFDADEKAFVDKNRDAIPGLAKDAADALDGPEGDALRKAEAQAKARTGE